MSERFRASALRELEIPPLPQFPRWANVRQRLGISSFGINAWTAQEAGQEVIQEHDELGERSGKHEELYVVMSGRATFTVDGEEIDAPAGTLVFVQPSAKRKAVAEEPETTVLAIGGRPGEAFTPSEWERSAPAFEYFATKEYTKAIGVLSEVLQDYPDDPSVLFNLACAESLAGKREEALEHLRQSIERDERFRELARTDTDFDPIRDEPRFKQIVG